MSTGIDAIDVHRVLVDAKTGFPRVRSGVVRRPRLTSLLAAGVDLPLIVVSAPVGYGKTTLLVDWLEHDDRAVAWVSLDRADDDVATLMTSIVTGVRRVRELDGAISRELISPDVSVLGRVVPGLAASIGAVDEPLVIVLDHFDEIRSRDCRDAVGLLLDLLPDHVQLVVSSRRDVWLAGGRRRVRGEVVEIGVTDLVFDADEVAELLELHGVEPLPERIRRLLERTEGWPAGLALLEHTQRSGAATVGFALAPSSSDRAVAEFIRSEVLAGLPPEIDRFLHGTAILDVLGPSLCDAVLDSTRSAAVLETLMRAGLFITPLDGSGAWFRYHPLFRSVLLDEASRFEPDTVRERHLRAARWWAAAGSVDRTVEHARAGGDLTIAADVIVRELARAYNEGRLNDVRRWLDQLADEMIERNPELAGLVGWLEALTGNAVEAQRWADRIEHLTSEGDSEVESFVSSRAALRAFLCAHGVEQMEADATSVVTNEPVWGPWRPASLGFLAVARWLQGDDDEAFTLFSESLEVTTTTDGFDDPEARFLAYRALLSMDRGDWANAERDLELAVSVVDRAHFSEYAINSIVEAARARLLLHRNETETGRASLFRAMRLRTAVTWVNPWGAAWLRLELADANLALGDPEAARILLHETEGVLYRRPKLGRLNARTDVLSATLSRWPTDLHGTALSTAELRLLPYLQTHLSLKEIGERLYVSRNTVSTQTNSIYRKLAVSGRSEAVDRARELGLLAPSVLG
ncbi:MAG TPA: LuxR C-terminal-related transcriptional regulator [Ilumatobacteraceae bacterium]|nr:LuxR C-terminal-related transcriptional regulator [Ilumatobacteraceae bacterium]HUW01856.1 LuxR C-terminal-related transcriptional regulator [Acidimicrobiales bacterium]